jgi:hypothetical protein
MKKDDFIFALQKRNTIILNDKAWYSQEWEDLIGLKQLTASINFGCKFGDDGKCHGGKLSWIGDHPACCCKECLENAGYHDIMLEKDIPFYAKKFLPKVGFWRKNKGCILPRKMRSCVCVSYSCKSINGIYTLKDIMNTCSHRLIGNFEKIEEYHS